MGWRRGLVVAYALFTAAMALLLVLGAVGGAPVTTSLAQATFWFVVAYALIRNHPKAPTLVWVLVVLSGLGTLMRGLIPLEILAFGLNLWFAVWYGRAVKGATQAPFGEPHGV
jgi:hypothetical protein